MGIFAVRTGGLQSLGPLAPGACVSQAPAVGLQYVEALPGRRLAPFVACYWSLRSPVSQRLRDRTFPDGCQEIVFNLGGAVRRSENGVDFHRNPATELIGQMTRPYDVLTEGEPLYFGIKFYPHGFSVFTREGIDTLRDQSIDLRLLFGTAFRAVEARIQHERCFERFVVDMEGFLGARLDEKRRDSRAFAVVDRVVAAIFRGPGDGTLPQACDDLGMGTRQLQASFRALAGLSPKQLAAMVRFQRSLPPLRSGRSLTEIAMACGYYDQAHFNHEFRRFSGMTPTDWKRVQAPLNGFFVDDASRAYLCNYHASGHRAQRAADAA